MKKEKLGHSSLQVSPLCLGTMYFGTRIPQVNSFALLDEYMELGGNFLDTANCYSFWAEGGVGDESELLLGQWFKERGCRNDVVLATKVGARPREKGTFGPVEGNSPARIKESLHESLKRLGTDYIDLFYLHLFDPETPAQDSLEALEGLKKEGKIRHYACSNHNESQLIQGKKISQEKGFEGYQGVQNWFSYLRPREGADMWRHVFADQEVLDFCKNEKMPLFAYSSLLSGNYNLGRLPDESFPALYDRFRGEENQGRLKKLLELAEEKQSTPNQVVLAWMLHQNIQIIPILGVSKISQLLENWEALELSLTQGDLEFLG